MWLEKVYEMLKAPLRTVFALLLFSSSIMIFPDILLEILGLSTFSKNNRPYLGVIFVLSLSLLATDLLGHLGKYALNKFKGHKIQKRMTAQLKKLSSFEKKIIISMYKQDGYTARLDYSDGRHSRLVEMNIIYRSSSVAFPGGLGKIMFPYTLQPWVTDYLIKYPDFIK